MSHFDEEYKKRPFLFGKEVTSELKYVVEQFDISGKALELGCGDGRDTVHMLKKGLAVDAVERSVSACNTLKNRNDISNVERVRLNIICTDVTTFAMTSNYYDFIYGVTLLDHLSPTVGERILKDCLKALKSGGYLFLKVHTVNDVGNTHLSKKISEFSQEIEHFYAENELLKQLVHTGTVLFYLETSEDDFDHGPPHTHAFASILYRKGE